MKTFIAVLLLTIPLAIAPAGADAPTIRVEMDGETYAVSQTATGTRPVATVTILDGEGLPAAGVSVRVAFIRQVQLVGYVGNETFTGTTNADGVFTVPAGTLSSLPGSYLVAAFALGTTGSDRYTVVGA